MGDFEVFGRKIERGGSPSVTLTKMGRFNFNKSAVALFEEKAVRHVLLMWDAQKRLVGFKPIPKKDSRAHKMSYAKRGDWCGFSSASFFRYISYKGEQSHTLPVKWDETQNMFISEIPEEFLNKKKNQPPTLVSKRHTKKSKSAMELLSEGKLEA